MSLKGVHAEAGIAYQIMVAAHWAIQMLLDEQIKKIEVNTTSLADDGQPIPVDDVVIYRTDGSAYYCQCKKNQTDFEPWRFTELKAELIKAGKLLSSNPDGTVYFYSRSPFGAVQKLQEHARDFDNDASYLCSLSKPNRITHDQLAGIWQNDLLAGGASVRNFLSRIHFETTGDVGPEADKQRRTLGLSVTCAGETYTKLIERLYQISSRTRTGGTDLTQAQVQSLNRSDWPEILRQAGATQAPPRAETALRAAFATTSAVGRHWQRSIGHARLPRQALPQLLAELETAPKSVLVTDGPGFGKTCLLLDLVEGLEASDSHACLFIQTREFAACANDAERNAHGLLADPLGSIARMAEFRHTVVVIDSLDVLSLTPGQGALNYFLSLIDRLQHCQNVTVVAACRDFDLQYDRRLANRQWSKTVSIGALDWEQDVCPLLSGWQIEPGTLPKPLQGLLTNPRLLALFWEITSRGGHTGASSAQELAEYYLATVVQKNPALGDAAMAGIEQLAQTMLSERRLNLPQKRANLPEELTKLLLSEGILLEPRPGLIAFGHQTLLDVLAVNAAERARETLLQFITRQHATPFIRPAIRTFFFQLRRLDTRGFGGQVRAVLDAVGVAYHIKRLLVESLVEVVPEDEDWRLVLYLFRSHLTLFHMFRWRARSTQWPNFLMRHWVPLMLAEQNAEELLTHVHSFQLETADQLELATTFWLQTMRLGWVDKDRLGQWIARELVSCKYWQEPRMVELLGLLVEAERPDHDFLGNVLARWVTATDSGDELLWQYITESPTATEDVDLNGKASLRCTPYTFPDRDFLAHRMAQSQILLELAITAIQRWSDQLTEKYGNPGWTRQHFLTLSSFRFAQGREDRNHDDAFTCLLAAVATGCMAHANRNPADWQRIEPKLLNSTDLALQCMAIRVYIEHPLTHLASITQVLTAQQPLPAILFDELGQLINISAPLLTTAQLEQLQLNILNMYRESWDTDQKQADYARSKLLRRIPAGYRTPAAQMLIDDANREFADHDPKPVSTATTEWVQSPFSQDALLQLSDTAITRLLAYHASPLANRPTQWQGAGLTGGMLEISRELHNAASRAPTRFLRLLANDWLDIDSTFRKAMFAGAGDYSRYGHDSTTPPPNWEPVEKPSDAEVALLLLAELERHGSFWQGEKEMADALITCANYAPESATGQLISQVATFSNAPGPSEEILDLLTTGINNVRGVAAQVVMTLANKLAARGSPLPELLRSTLRSFAKAAHPAIGAIILSFLPGLQAHESELGWEIFEKIMACGHPEIGRYAERWLYSCCRKDFDRVAPHLATMELLIHHKTSGQAWGRIAALASLAGKIPQATLLEKLRDFKSEPAWRGATQVFVANAKLTEYRDDCHQGILAVLQIPEVATAVTSQFNQLFDSDKPTYDIPTDILRGLFAVAPDYHYFPDWLLARVDAFPDEALNAIEIMLGTVEGTKSSHMYLGKQFLQTLTRLLREAEEREQSDQGQFLARVIAVQDLLHKHDTPGMQEWLTAAERP